MARLNRRKNLIPFALIFAAGFMAIGLIPPMFSDAIIEIPSLVVIPAEIAVAFIMSVLLFENSSPADLVRIALVMLGFIMSVGAFGNYMTKTTQGMPDGTLLLNWVQLAVMNIAGILSTVGYYSTKPEERADRLTTDETLEPTITAEERLRLKQEALEDESESAADILAKLDPSRFENIGRSKGGMISSAALSGPGKSKLTAEELAEALETEAELEIKMEEKAEAKSLTPEPAASGPLLKVSDEEVGGLFDNLLKDAVDEMSTPAGGDKATDSKAGGGLLNVSDDDIGGLFDNIVADPTVTKDALAGGNKGDVVEVRPGEKINFALGGKDPGVVEVRPGEKINFALGGKEPEVAESKPANKNLLNVSDDDIGGLFDNIVADPTVTKDEVKGDKPITPGAGGKTPQADKGGKQGKGKNREVKEFGRLSATASNKASEAPPGTLKTIGQMLLDTSAVEGLIRNAEGRDPSSSTAKVVSVDKGADIQALLNKIASYPGANGSLLIGKDGLLVGATESLGFMKDVLGPLSLAMLSTTKLGTTKLDFGELQQIVFKSGDKLTILTEVGMGVLAVYSDAYNQASIDGLLEWIDTTVKESGSVGEAPTAELGSIFSAKPDAAEAPAVAAKESSPVAKEKVAEEKIAEETVAEEKVAAQTPAAAEKKGGLLNVSDDDIGGLFDDIVADPTVTKDSMGGEPKKSSMDFSPEEKQKEAAAAEAAGAEKKAKSNVKEFGRLSASTAAPAQNQEVGTIKSIGRQLIDVQAVENIIKSGEKKGEKIGSGLTTARVISSARGEGIKMLLQKIDTAPGVAGSLIVGNDGLVIASTLGSNMDKDTLGVLCTAMHSHSELAAKKLEMGKLRQIIFHAEGKLTVLTAVAVGVLAVFVEHRDVEKIDDLLTAIESTVRG